MKDLDLSGLATSHFVAAFVGSLVGLKAMPGASIWQRIGNLCLGFGLAVFAGPALAEWAGVTSPKIQAGVVFACGAAGLVAFSAVVDGIKQTPLAQIITGWLSRRGTHE